VFTTGIQIEHFLDFAGDQGKREAAVDALRRIFIASIGPTCTESLRACGLAPNIEPTHPKMGSLIREAAEQFALTSTRDI
jgi:uroporphyrinogen-III synthase